MEYMKERLGSNITFCFDVISGKVTLETELVVKLFVNEFYSFKYQFQLYILVLLLQYYSTSVF